MALVETQLSREAMPLMAIRPLEDVAAQEQMGQLVEVTLNTAEEEEERLA